MDDDTVRPAFDTAFSIHFFFAYAQPHTHTRLLARFTCAHTCTDTYTRVKDTIKIALPAVSLLHGDTWDFVNENAND